MNEKGGTYVARILRTLIDSDKRRAPATLCPKPKRLHKFQALALSNPLVLLSQQCRCPTRYTLSDTHPLPLPTRHAVDEVASNSSMEDVRGTEHGEDGVSHVSRAHRAGDGPKTVMRRSSVQCKEEYRKVWKMDICLAL